MPELSPAKRALLNRYLAGKLKSTDGIPRRTTGPIAPQSLNQEQVWTHSQIIGSKPAYNELITIHRRGPLDIPTLERAIDALTRRHEIWRTTFEMGENSPVQIIHASAAPVKLRVFDLRTLALADRARECTRLAAADGRTPFNLTKLPLWRAILVRLADDEYQLHMNLHQLVLDGVTVYRTLLPELIALYNGTALQEPAPQYADFSIWQRAKLTDEALQPHLEWWKKQLAGPLPTLGWPNEKPRPEVQSYNGATEMLRVPLGITDGLRAYAERESATLFMALAAGFFTLMHLYTGETDIILGMPTAARSRETEGIMGYFLNLLPVRVDLSHNPTNREVLRRVRAAVLDALEHGQVPLLKLLEAVRPKRDDSRNPLFQIMISLEPPMAPVDPAWDLTQASVSSGSTKMDMYLNLDTRPDGLMAPIMYNPDLLESATVRRMFDDWQSVLQAAASSPDCPIAELVLNKKEIPTAIEKPTFAGRLKGWLKRTA